MKLKMENKIAYVPGDRLKEAFELFYYLQLELLRDKRRKRFRIKRPGVLIVSYKLFVAEHI